MEFWFRSPPKIDVAGSGVTVARTLDWDWAFTHPHRDSVSSPLALDNLPGVFCERTWDFHPIAAPAEMLQKRNITVETQLRCGKSGLLAATELG